MPETVILQVLMHCVGCTKAVKRACARIPGVATYRVDYLAQRVTVTGDVTSDEVLKCVLKTGKHAELVSRTEQPAEKEDKKIMGEESTLVVQTVILKVVLHCEGCARTVKRAVKRIPGVTAYDVDFPGQKVTVTGVVTPEDVYRHVSRTGKITVLVPPPPPPPEPEPPKVEEPPKEEPPKEEPKAEEPPAPPAEEPKAEEPPAPPAPPAEEPKAEEPPAPPAEEPKAEEPKKEEEAKAEEPAAPAPEEPAAPAAPAAEEAKPEEAKPEEKKEEAPAPAAEEKKPEEAKPDPPPPPAEEKPAPPPPPTLEELYPVTFVLGPDYTRYYYY